MRSAEAGPSPSGKTAWSGLGWRKQPVFFSVVSGVERLVSLAPAQALGAWQTHSVIAERARHASRASREDFLRFMDQVPDHEPVEGDKVK